MAGLPIADRSRGTGYQLVAANPVNTSANLPQKIAVLAEMNDANQTASLTPTIITSRAQAAALYGWGSPMDMIFRILFPQSGGGVAGSGIEVTAYPVLAAVGAVANVQTITVTGTATGSATHTLLIGGRAFLEGGAYSFTVVSGQTPTQTATAIKNAINAVLGCPFTATSAAGVVTLTCNWKGASGNDLTVNVIPGLVAAGVSYAVATGTAGSGVPTTVPATLATFGTKWQTLVVTGWNLAIASSGSLLAQYIAFNGNVNTLTGQWAPMVMRPAIYLIGNLVDSTTSSADTTITAAFPNDMTFAVCSTPLSLGTAAEAAANYAVNFANVSNNTPNIDIQAIALPDMPGILPGGANPSQNTNYDLRNALLALGMTTVIYNNSQYFPQDFITTFAPQGIPNPAFSYSRDPVIDMNIEYKFKTLQRVVIGNNQIAADNDVVTASNVVKPKDVKGALFTFADELVSGGFTTDSASMKASVVVVINASNKNRFDISFSYTRSGVTRVVSTVATVNA